MSQNLTPKIYLTEENYNFLLSKGISVITFNNRCNLANIVFTAAKGATEGLCGVNHRNFKKHSKESFPFQMNFIVKEHKWRKRDIGLRSLIAINYSIDAIIKKEFLVFIKTKKLTDTKAKSIHTIIDFLKIYNLDDSPEAIERWRKYEQRNRNKQITFL